MSVRIPNDPELSEPKFAVTLTEFSLAKKAVPVPPLMVAGDPALGAQLYNMVRKV